MNHAQHTILFITGLIAAAGCSSSNTVTGSSNMLPGGMGVVGSVPTDTLVGSTLSITYHVTDANGVALQGALVRWDLVSGVGALSADSARTDASGNAAVDWTLDTTAGPNRMEARTGLLQGLLLTVDGNPDRPATVHLSSDTLSFNVVGDTLRLTTRVKDRYGNTIETPGVVWSSANTAVATVDSAGRVVSRAAGQTLVTATADTASSSAVVIVQ
jgi:hypothetical protein